MLIPKVAIDDNQYIIDATAAIGQEILPDWPTIFGNAAPLHIEIGPGKGQFLLDLAEQQPENNFLGIEIRRKRVAKINSKLLRGGFTNVRLILANAKTEIDALLAPASAAEFFIHFPDPWPKQRHRRRRLFDHEFIGKLQRLLLPGGKVYITTDVEDYAQKIAALFQDHGAFVQEYARNDDFTHPYHRTIHEWKFKLWGRKIHYFCYRNDCPPPG